LLPDSYLALIGILLLSLVAVESGGVFLARVVTGGHPANALQTSFFRAGHAHAAVLLVLSVALLTPLSQAYPGGVVGAVARTGVPTAAILMPAVFFLSVVGRDAPRPGRLVVLLGLGAASLTAGLLAAGVAILPARRRPAHRGTPRGRRRSPPRRPRRVTGAARFDGSLPPSTPDHPLHELVAVMDRLRSPGGCPWEAAQTHASLAKHTLEEA